MILFRTPWIASLVAIVWVAGCAHQSPPQAGSADVPDHWARIELVQAERREPQLLILPRAMRVEKRVGGHEELILFPNRSNDCQRIAEVISELARHPRWFDVIAAPWAKNAPRNEIRVVWASGRRDVISFVPRARTRSFILDGLCREVEAVAMNDFADAIFEHRKGEAEEAANDSHAVYEYQFAINDWFDWLNARQNQFDAGDYEPDTKVFWAEVDGKRWGVSVNLRDITRLPGMTDAAATKVLKEEWDYCLKGVTMTTRSNVTVVSFDYDDVMPAVKAAKLTPEEIAELTRDSADGGKVGR